MMDTTPLLRSGVPGSPSTRKMVARLRHRRIADRRVADGHLTRLAQFDPTSVAMAEGKPEVNATVEGQPWVQQAFPYQGKCLTWLRQDDLAPDASARARVDRALAGTGCECLFAGLRVTDGTALH
jgi:hypothetical protein